MSDVSDSPTRYNDSMLSLEPELRTLQEQRALDEASAHRLIALERRELFSLYGEIRTVLYAGVALIITGAGLFLKDNVDRLGHATLISIIAFASAICYVLAWRAATRQASAHDSRPTTHNSSEYLLLLAALLLSAGVGYAEAQYRFFGDAWTRHLLILAAVHAFAAYLFGSRLVLSLAITSLAGWLGVDRSGAFLGESAPEAGARLLLAGAAVAIWRILHTIAFRPPHSPLDPRASFQEVFDHFVAHLAMIGALVWVFSDELELTGLALLVAFVTISIVSGVRTGRELFVIYGLLYGVIGIDAAVIRRIDSEMIAVYLWLLVTTPLAIAAWFWIRRGMRAQR